MRPAVDIFAKNVIICVLIFYSGVIILKKLAAVILAVILAFGAVASASAQADSPAKLQFNEDGSFRIMQISDIQDGTILTPATKTFLKDVVIDAQPDLIVLTGDNISAGSATLGTEAVDKFLVKTAINNFMSVFEEIGVPVAVVFGNHDAEQKVSKEYQMEVYSSYDCCIANDDNAELYGCGTYNVPIYSSSDSEKIAYNLWMMDSNMYDEDGYDHVHQDQLDWYVKTSNELKAANGGEPVPSMMFQHIIVNEIYDALIKLPNVTDISVNGYVLDPAITRAGELNEAPCPPAKNGGQFETVVKQGDVVAMHFGHDHKNTFEITYKGVDLVNSPTSGFGSYGDHNRGVRIIDIKEGTREYNTYLITYLDFYKDNDYMLAQYDLFANESGVGEVIVALFKTLIFGFVSLF